MRLTQILAPTVLFVAACGNKASTDATSPLRADSVASAPAPAASEQVASASAGSFSSIQKLIRTAELRIQVSDVPGALSLADGIAQRQHILLADSRTRQDADGRRTADVVLRVPTQQFTELLQALRRLGSVQSESINAQDVTKDYADLETRLAVKAQTVTRLRSLLENRTAKLSDVLDVERELGRAVAELEQMKGEQRYYDQQIALSTVRLTVFERIPSQTAQVTKPVVDALEGSLHVLGNSIGAIIYLVVATLPWGLASLAVVWLVQPLRRRFVPRLPGNMPPAA